MPETPEAAPASGTEVEVSVIEQRESSGSEVRSSSNGPTATQQIIEVERPVSSTENAVVGSVEAPDGALASTTKDASDQATDPIKKPEDDSGDEDAAGKKGLCISILTLAISIPALIGA